MRIQDIEYSADGASMIGQLAVDDARPGKRPGVLVCHEGPGLTDHTKKIVRRLAELGSAAFAMDYHGGGKPLANPTETQPRLAVWRADPTGIRARAAAALEVLKAQPETDTARLAATGYCFGGTVDWRLQLYGGAGHSFTNPASDSRGMKGFFYHQATDRRSWYAMIEPFNETLGATK